MNQNMNFATLCKICWSSYRIFLSSFELCFIVCIPQLAFKIFEQ